MIGYCIGNQFEKRALMSSKLSEVRAQKSSNPNQSLSKLEGRFWWRCYLPNFG